MNPSLRWKVGLTAVALFVAGAACGALLTARIGMNLVRQIVNAPEGTTKLLDRGAGRLTGYFDSDYKLTAEQSMRIEMIITQTTRDLANIRVETSRATRQKLRSAVEELAAALPPDQREQFRRDVEKRARRLGVPLADSLPPQP